MFWNRAYLQRLFINSMFCGGILNYLYETMMQMWPLNLMQYMSVSSHRCFHVSCGGPEAPSARMRVYWASWAPFTAITAAVVPPPCTCSPRGPHHLSIAAPKSHIVGDGISIPTLSETRNLLSRSQIPPASPPHILHLLWCTFCVYLNCDLGHPLELLRCDVSRGYGGGQAEGSGSLAGRGSRASGAGLE